MKRLRILPLLLAAAMMACLFSGCGTEKVDVRVAYVSGKLMGNSDSSALVYRTHKVADVDEDRLYRLAIQLAATDPEDDDYYSVIPENIKINSIKRRGSTVSVDFDSSLGELEGIRRTLAMYCITMTLCSFDGVEAVSITVNGEATGNILRMDELICSRKQLKIVNYDISLCFPDRLNNKCKRVDAEISLSEASEPVVEAVRMLLQGQNKAKLVEEDSKTPILLSVTVRNRVCYVNFSEDFISGSVYSDQGVNLSAYSVINTLCQFTHVDRVKILSVGVAAGKRLGLGTDEPVYPNPALMQ